MAAILPKVFELQINPERYRTFYSQLSYEQVKRQALTAQVSIDGIDAVYEAYVMAAAAPTPADQGRLEAKAMYERVHCNPKILSGIPVIKGTRIPVSMILACLADGYTADQIREEYPRLSAEDITEAILYASHLTEQDGRGQGRSGFGQLADR